MSELALNGQGRKETVESLIQKVGWLAATVCNNSTQAQAHTFVHKLC